MKTVRQTLGWTQAEMAERLGLDRSNISRYETGQQELKGPAKKLFEQLCAEVDQRKAGNGASSDQPIVQVPTETAA